MQQSRCCEESSLVRARSWSQTYCFWGLRDRESRLQEVKRARLSSKNRISSSSWRLKEILVLEGRLWKSGSLKQDCLSVSAAATPQWRSSLHLKNTIWRVATLQTWMGSWRHTASLLQVQLFHPLQIVCLQKKRMLLLPAFLKHLWHCFMPFCLSYWGENEGVILWIEIVAYIMSNVS